MVTYSLQDFTLNKGRNIRAEDYYYYYYYTTLVNISLIPEATTIFILVTFDPMPIMHEPQEMPHYKLKCILLLGYKLIQPQRKASNARFYELKAGIKRKQCFLS